MPRAHIVHHATPRHHLRTFGSFLRILASIAPLLLAAPAVSRAQYVVERVGEGGIFLRFTSPSEAYAFGPTRVVRTIDSGRTWDLITPDIHAATGCDGIYGGSFVGGGKGWIVAYKIQQNDAYKTFIYRTTDGGGTWTLQRSAPAATMVWGGHGYSQVHFVDGMNGWVVGKGIVERTTDGGATWSTQLLLPEGTANNDYFTALHFIDGREGWVSGYGSFILHTRDGGATWSTQHVDSLATGGIIQHIDYYYLHDIHFADRMNGVAAANNGNYLYTRDGGATWSGSRTGAPNDNVGIYMIDARTIWQAGGDYCDNTGCYSGRSLLFSRDGGASWSALDTATLGPLGLGSQFRAIHFINPRLGYVTNDDGTIFRIRDTSAVLSGVALEEGKYRMWLR